MSAKKNIYCFKEVSPQIHSPTKDHEIYIASLNDKSSVTTNFKSLDDGGQRMFTTILKFISEIGRKYNNREKIRWKLKPHTFGEIKPCDGHRFFFFTDKKRVVLYEYAYKTKNKLSSTEKKNP